MAVEIERKFLVRGEGWRGVGEPRDLVQGYLSLDPERTVRVRVDGGTAVLTVKGGADGPRRDEIECELVPRSAAHELLERFALGSVVRKTRHVVRVEGVTWEVDEFGGDNDGLVVAELEAPPDEDPTRFFDEALHPDRRPTWLGEEVTDDHRYTNAALAERPWSTWGGSAG